MNKRERLEVLLFMLKRVHQPRRNLRPVHVVIPAMFAEMILLSLALWFDSVPHVALGSLVVAALAMLPSMFQQKKRVIYHWVN